MQATLTPPAHHTVRESARAAVREAAENVAYWKRQAMTRTQPPAIAQAKGLATIWETTRKVRQARLDTLSAIISSNP